jgi:short-subunit dehydrogenase
MTSPIGPGERAVVTGASWGIGETFAETLAARGADLLLVARNEARLRTLADTLVERYGVRVEIVALDLAEPDGPRRLVEAADALGFEPTMLVNNAGVGVLGPFADLPVERAREMVRLNVVALTDLTYRLLVRMQARGSGSIVNVASASAFQPLPNYAVYAATKAFVISFTAALWAEARSRGVRVIAVCPGAVDAGEPAGAAGSPRPRRQLRRKVTREGVVTAALDALAHDRPVVVPGGPPAVARFALGLLPRRSRLRFTGMLLRRYPAMLTGKRRRDPPPQTAPEDRSPTISSSL